MATNSAFEGLLSSVQYLNQQKARRKEAEAHLSQVEELAQDRDEWAITNAANYTEKHALRAALSKIDPTHPLLVNKQLQEQIRNLGKRIASMGGSSEDMSQAAQDLVQKNL